MINSVVKKGTRLLLALGVLCAIWLVPATALAQDEPLVDESFSIRLDETLFQLEEAVTLIASSLTKVAGQVEILAINSMHFGRNVDADFRRKAEVIILEKLLDANPRVKLVQCQECQKLETKIQRGILVLRKGIPSREARLALAEKLGVDGFIDIGMFQSHGQLTVYLKVVEAKSGAIILVDETAGRRAPKRDSITISFGELSFPINYGKGSTDHRALTLTATEAVRLTDRFSFSVDLGYFLDNNENNTDPHLTLTSGLVLAPTLGFDMFRLPASTSRLLYYIGLGKLLAPQLDYGNFFRTGVEFIVGDNLVLAFGFNYYLSANVSVTDADVETEPKLEQDNTKLDGVGNELRFGYRF